MFHKSLNLTVLVILLACLLTAPAAARAEGTLTLQGVVSSDRAFCANAALLSLVPLDDPLAEPLTAVTGAGGAYTLAGLDSITYTGTLTHTGCETLQREFTLDSPVVTWSPVLSAQRYSIRGALTRALDGAPIPAMDVAYTIDGRAYTTSTGSDGVYTIAAVYFDQTISVPTPVYPAYQFSPAGGYSVTGLTESITTWHFQAAGTRVVSGTITGAEGIPARCIAGAPLTFSPYYASEGPTQTALSALDGSFSINTLQPIRYTLNIAQPGCGYVSLPYTIPGSLANITALNITATAAAHTLSGQVTSGAPAAGLADVSVHFALTPASGGTFSLDTLTGANGDYMYPYSLNSGDALVISFSKTGYHFSPAQINLPNITASLTGQDSFGAVNTYTVAGRILRAVTGAPVSGVSVGFDGQTIITGADGRYHFSDVPYGTSGAILPTAPGETFLPSQHNISSLVADISETDPAGQFLAVANPALSGTITYKGKPLAGVTLAFAGQTTVTGVNGAYRFASLPPGTSADLVPTKAGYQFTPEKISLNLPAASELGAPDVIGQNFTALRVFSVRGKVTAKDGKTPLPGVALTCGAFAAASDAQGVYILLDIPEGTKCSLTPSLGGYRFIPAKISLTVSASLNAATLRGIRVFPVSGQVTGAGGPLEGVKIALGSLIAYTGADGNYTLPAVDEGVSGTLLPTKSGYHFAPASLRITRLSGALAAQDFSATPNVYTLSGTLKAGTAPVASATLQVNGSDGRSAVITSDRYGRYFFKTATYGVTYTFTPVSPGYTFTPAQYAFPIKAANQVYAFRATVVQRVFQGQIRGLPVGQIARVSYGSGAREYVLTAADGSFVTPALPANRAAALKPTLAGFLFTPPVYVCDPGNETILTPVFDAIPSVMLTGKISVGGKAVPGVIVTLGTRAVVTSSTGSYSLEVPRSSDPGMIIAVHPYFHFAPHVLTPDASQVLNWTDASVMVSGQVTDAMGSGAAAVLRVSPGQSIATAADGSFMLEVRAIEKVNLWSFTLRIEPMAGDIAKPTYRAVTPALGSLNKNFVVSKK